MIVLLVSTALSLSLPDKVPRELGGALLQVRLANFNGVEMESWLRSRSFAAVLPIQPMLIQPLSPPLSGLELTFRRKPNSEKGGVDGGLRFVLSDASADDAGEGAGMLLVSRISEGQYTSKMFSERKLLRKLVADLETLPSCCATVNSIVDLTAPADEGAS